MPHTVQIYEVGRILLVQLKVPGEFPRKSLDSLSICCLINVLKPNKRVRMECKLNESVSEKYLLPWDRLSFPVGADPPPRNMFSDACSRCNTGTFTLIFFFIHGGKKKACCQSSKWVRLRCPNLPDRCFISSDGCFLAVTTVHVLSSEKKTVWFSAPSPFKVTFCLSSLLSARFFYSFQSFSLSAWPSSCFRRIRRKILPSER